MDEQKWIATAPVAANRDVDRQTSSAVEASGEGDKSVAGSALGAALEYHVL
jgi:hypothetical protein